MRLIESLVRRLRQLPLLVDAPSELRRQHPRHAVEAVLRITGHNGETGDHLSVDISHGGVFVAPLVSGDTGDRVLVSASDLLEDAPATIVVHRMDGTALKFESVVHGAALTAWLVRHPSGHFLN